MTATIYIERNEQEFEIAVEGVVYRGEPECSYNPRANPGTDDEVMIEFSAIVPTGEIIELTPEERERAERALLDKESDNERKYGRDYRSV